MCAFLKKSRVKKNHRISVWSVGWKEGRVVADTESLVEIFAIPNRNCYIGWGRVCEKDLHTLRCTAEKRPVRVVVVMRILLQPFTSFGCHGYTAGGPSSWTPRREQGEGGMLGSMALSVAASPLFPCIN